MTAVLVAVRLAAYQAVLVVVRLTMARVVLAQPVVRQQAIQRVRRVSYRLRGRWERYRGPSIVMAY